MLTIIAFAALTLFAFVCAMAAYAAGEKLCAVQARLRATETALQQSLARENALTVRCLDLQRALQRIPSGGATRGALPLLYPAVGRWGWS